MEFLDYVALIGAPLSFVLGLLLYFRISEIVLWRLQRPATKPEPRILFRVGPGPPTPSPKE